AWQSQENSTVLLFCGRLERSESIPIHQTKQIELSICFLLQLYGFELGASEQSERAWQSQENSTVLLFCGRLERSESIPIHQTKASCKNATCFFILIKYILWIRIRN
ncbi:MAG: hypothetical protein KBT30_01150, partial [Clostridiales bacterium]|nr:hypothetical protein [Candidatus Apopatousia equi]